MTWLDSRREHTQHHLGPLRNIPMRLQQILATTFGSCLSKHCHLLQASPLLTLVVTDRHSGSCQCGAWRMTVLVVPPRVCPMGLVLLGMANQFSMCAECAWLTWRAERRYEFFLVVTSSIESVLTTGSSTVPSHVQWTSAMSYDTAHTVRAQWLHRLGLSSV